MVHSEFRTIVYFSIGVILIMTLGALFGLYAVFAARDVNFAAISIMLFITAYEKLLLATMGLIAKALFSHFSRNVYHYTMWIISLRRLYMFEEVILQQ